jgi:vacuolar-type H+-ATPase subunit I/STV1
LLHHRGALQQEDEKVLNELSTKAEALKAAYQHTESAFREKFERVRFAMDNPNQVNQQVEQQEAQSALDKALNIDRENNAPPASEQTGGGENNSISGEFLTL